MFRLGAVRSISFYQNECSDSFIHSVFKIIYVFVDAGLVFSKKMAEIGLKLQFRWVSDRICRAKSYVCEACI